MVTTVGTESTLADLLVNLVHLDYDAAEAYGEAVKRLDDVALRNALEGMKADHERHITELSEVLRSMGETPPGGGDMKQMLTTGKVAMGAMVGDTGILRAMRSNEQDTNTAYERAAGHDEATGPVREMLERNLADERRHRDYIEGALSKM